MNFEEREELAAQELALAIVNFVRARDARWAHYVATRLPTGQAGSKSSDSSTNRDTNDEGAGPTDRGRSTGMKPPQNLLIAAREAARLLSISERTLWTMTAPRGPIPVVRLGRVLRYSIDDLVKVVETLKED